MKLQQINIVYNNKPIVIKTTTKLNSIFELLPTFEPVVEVVGFVVVVVEVWVGCVGVGVGVGVGFGVGVGVGVG